MDIFSANICLSLFWKNILFMTTSIRVCFSVIEWPFIQSFNMWIKDTDKYHIIKKRQEWMVTMLIISIPFKQNNTMYVLRTHICIYQSIIIIYGCCIIWINQQFRWCHAYDLSIYQDHVQTRINIVKKPHQPHQSGYFCNFFIFFFLNKK